MHKAVVIGAAVIAWLIAAAVGGFAQELGNYPWGASPRAVAEATGAVPDSQGSGTLVKRDTVLGTTAFLTYRFFGGGLSAVGIQWYSDRFVDVQKLLDGIYGPGRCTTNSQSCEWTTPHSTVRLIEDSRLGVTLLVYSKKPGG